MGAVSTTQRLTIDCISLLEQLEPTETEQRSRLIIREAIQQQLSSQWKFCRVVAFGSSESCLATGSSDLDLAIFFNDMTMEQHTALMQAEKTQVLWQAALLLTSLFEIKEFIQHARVPLLKLWSSQYQIACDLCIGGAHVLFNTAMLRYYVELDSRVRPLAFAIKYWAKCRGINDSVNGTLSSYGYSLLLIFYLQNRIGSDIFPSCQNLFHKNIMSSKDIDILLKKLRQMPSKEIVTRHWSKMLEIESVGSLLAGFFQFYATEFDYEENVVSVRAGRATSKSSKWDHVVPWRFSIEDPFEVDHDVARVIFDQKGFELIMKEVRRADEMIQLGHRLEDICNVDSSLWLNLSSCYICNGLDHKARHCTSRTTRSNTHTACWYCGEQGHVKASCPLFRFLDIPQKPATIVTDHSNILRLITAPKCQSIQVSQADLEVSTKLSIYPTPSARKKKKFRHATSTLPILNKSTKHKVSNSCGFKAESRQKMEKVVTCES